jgi:Gas vesicle synthesis protein GvpO
MAESDNNGSDGRVSVTELARSAKEAVKELTGFPAETVSGIERNDDGWRVTVDVCELERVPSTTDVMATYEVELDDRGEVVGYKRARRFQRAQAQGD